jgi:hypothetical protein
MLTLHVVVCCIALLAGAVVLIARLLLAVYFNVFVARGYRGNRGQLLQRTSTS